MTDLDPSLLDNTPAASTATLEQPPDSRFGQPRQGQVSEGVYTDRVGGVQNVIPNLIKDVPQVAGQLGALASFPFVRTYESLPPVPGIKETPALNPLRDISTGPPELAKGIWDYVNNEYVGPYQQRHKEMFPLIPPDYLGYLANEWTKAPLQVGMDLAPGEFQAPKILGELGSKAANVLDKTHVGTGLKGKVLQTVADNMAKMGEKNPISKWYQDTIVPNLTGELGEEGTIHKQLVDKLATLDRTRIDKLNQLRYLLDKYWQPLPHEVKLHSAAIGEHTDRQLRRKYAGNIELNKFLNVARGINRAFESIFQLPDDVNLRNKWGAPYLAMLERMRRASIATLDAADKLPKDTAERARFLDKQYPNLANPLKFEDLTQPQHMKALIRYRERMNKYGINAPIHAALATQVQLQALFNNVEHKLGGIAGNKTAQAARLSARKGFTAMWDNPDKLPYYLQERNSAFVKDLDKQMSIRDPIHSLNTRDLLFKAAMHAYQFEAIRDFVREIMSVAPQKGWEEVDLKMMMKNIFAQTGAEQKNVDKFFKDLTRQTGVVREELGTVYLPPKTAKWVRESLEGTERPGMIGRFLDTWNRTAKTARFTLDPSFVVRLAAQTAAIQAWSINTPKEAVGLLVSHILALHPAARSAVPDVIMLSHGGAPVRPRMLYAGLTWERVRHWPGLGIQGINDLTYRVIHNTQRRAAALNFLLYTLKDSKWGDVFAPLLNMSTALEVAKGMTFNEKNLKALHDFMAHNFGDYSAEISKMPFHRTMGRIYLVWPWVRHATNLLKTVPDHPYKIAIGHMVAKVAAKGLQPPGETEPLKEQGFIAVAEKNKYMRGWNLDVIESGLGMIGAAASVLWGGAEVNIPSTMTPGAATGIELLKGGMDVITGKKFLDENPDVKQKYGRYYDRRTNKLIPKSELWRYSHPNMLRRAAENTFTKQANFIKGISTQEHGQLYVPAQGSFPGKLMTRHGGIPRDWEDFWLQAIGISTR